jgi:peptidoglycan LD-endopeptidase LytH
MSVGSRPRLSASALLLILTACVHEGAREAVPETCDQNATSITDTSVGPLYVGEAVGSLRVRCAAVADTTVVIPRAGSVDTIAAKRLTVAGVPVLATHENDRVVALRVTAPGPRTLYGVEVGTGIARFRSEPGIRVTRSPQTGVVVLQDRTHCGATFELSGWGGTQLPLEGNPPLAAPELVAWPDSIRITAITVATCTDRSNNRSVDSAFNARDDSVAAERAAIEALPDPRLTQLPEPAQTPSADVPPAPPPPAGVAAPVTSTSEMDALRRQLIVPVQGIARSALRDTYKEARGTRTHEALDLPAPRGTPVVSAMDGKLMRLFDSKTGGLMVYASDPTDQYILLYGHLERYADGMRNGMPLKQGQVIGYVGTTGNAPPNTPHLHFGIMSGTPSVSWSRGTAVNPYELLKP